LIEEKKSPIDIGVRRAPRLRLQGGLAYNTGLLFGQAG
jgi:hypothetical protein